MSIVKDLRLRLGALVALIALSLFLAGSPNTASACETCVFPDPGSAICVACAAMSGSGFNTCMANQSTCSCTVSGGSCSNPD